LFNKVLIKEQQCIFIFRTSLKIRHGSQSSRTNTFKQTVETFIARHLSNLFLLSTECNLLSSKPVF